MCGVQGHVSNSCQTRIELTTFSVETICIGEQHARRRPTATLQLGQQLQAYSDQTGAAVGSALDRRHVGTAMRCKERRH